MAKNDIPNTSPDYRPDGPDNNLLLSPADRARNKIRNAYHLTDQQMTELELMVAKGLSFAEALKVQETQPDSTPDNPPAGDMNARLRTALGR
jgi:hypothetical protein